MRSRHIFLMLLALWGLCVSRPAFADDRPRRVLILDSFGRGVAPNSAYIVAFRRELRDRWTGPLDLFEVSLESARSRNPEEDESLVNFLAAHLTRDPVDLVAVFAAPAMRFAARHRQRLFSDVPMLVAAVEQRMLPRFLPAKTATVGHRYDLVSIVEDILQVLPATRQIFVVFGVSPMERFWSDESRRAFARFENRVQFRWLEKLPAEAMKREVASLPRESVLLYGMLLRDADGLSFEGEDALIRLRAVSKCAGLRVLREPNGCGDRRWQAPSRPVTGCQGCRSCSPDSSW